MKIPFEAKENPSFLGEIIFLTYVLFRGKFLKLKMAHYF